MKKYLLPEEGQFYKVNMHCHTNISDGKLTPEEVKQAYMAQGYSAVAYTDHDVFIRHPELTDENFVALNGYEVEINRKKEGNEPCGKTCHICLVAKSPDTKVQVCWHRSDYLFSNAVKYRDKVVFDESLPDYVREYSHKGINEIVDLAHEGGFFATYNHPNWSREDWRDYSGYDKFDAMEIINGASVYEGFAEHNERTYDDMTFIGKRLYCIGADDNHRAEHNCLAWISVKAPCLEYTALTSAIEKGEFYSSEGPEIKSLYVEDGKVYIKTSPCRKIRYIAASRNCAFAGDGTSPVTEAVFEIPAHHYAFRIQIEDDKGMQAYTNYYFTEDVL